MIGLPSAPEVCNSRECLLSSIHDGLLCNLGYLSKCVGHDYGWLGSLGWPPPRQVPPPKFRATASEGVGVGDTKFCQSKSSWLGKSYKDLSWVMGMYHAGPACMSTCVEGVSFASSCDCGSTERCTTSDACGMLNLHMLSELLVLVASTSQWWTSALWWVGSGGCTSECSQCSLIIFFAIARSLYKYSVGSCGETITSTNQ